jgi:hypothetical protein
MANQAIEQLLESAELMLGSDKSRGYCLEMICADFLGRAHLENGNPTVLLCSMLRLFRFLPTVQKEEFLSEITEPARPVCQNSRELAWAPTVISSFGGRCLSAMGGAARPAEP